ncbi:MAG: ATP-binding protein, partial [Gammaproteobacteria bacterium]|nr:ATP-binding protein [Gammaproteobacteria bacterium]
DIIGTRRKEHSDTAETKAEKESWERHIADLQAHRPFKDFEYGFKLDDERIMYVRVSGTPIFDSDGLFLGYRGAASDITEKKEAERALRISQQRLLLHRDQSPIGVIEWNTDFTFNDWNPAAERIFGFTKEEVQNQHITDRILPESARPAVDKIWEDLLAQKGGTYSLNENITKEGRIILCEWHNTPLVDEDGNVIGVTSIVDDVTERVATDHAQLEKEKAEAAAQAKGEFLANMSHEIRTPLTAVLGMAKIGIRDCKDSRDKGTFNQIFDSGRHLLRIINDILDFSKIEAGKLTIETSPFQLISTVENPVNMLIERALAKDLKLSVNLPSSLPGWVLGDPLRLQQILLNLVSNAIKFTAEGEVLVSVSRVGSMTHFKVTDTGVGLNEEQVSRLFTPFEQADTSTTRNYGGTGLGLAISYNLAKLMGGKISVESQVNRGSTFTLSLPFSETDTPNIKDSAAPEKLGPQLEGLQVLAAEDVDLNRLILEDILEQEGASVVFAEDGQQAIDHLQQIGVGNIDVVLMDIQMPVMDGYEATRRIVEMAPGLPVIGITAHALVEERDKCFAAGMVDIVTKPFEIEDLITSLKQHVDRFAMILK